MILDQHSLEREALHLCAPLIERVQNKDMASVLSSVIVLSFTVGAVWALDDPVLMAQIQAKLRGER